MLYKNKYKPLLCLFFLLFFIYKIMMCYFYVENQLFIHKQKFNYILSEITLLSRVNKIT